MGETKTPNIIGLTVIFNKKPFKQLGKIALGSLLKGFLLNMTVNPIILGVFVSPIIIK
jgi:hypothetical protein